MMTVSTMSSTSPGIAAGAIAEAHDEHEQPDRAPQAEADAARPRAHRERAEDDEKFEDEFDILWARAPRHLAFYLV